MQGFAMNMRREVFKDARVREALGIELREITERSKIGMSYLVALEGDLGAGKTVFAGGLIRAKSSSESPSRSSRPTTRVSSATRSAYRSTRAGSRPPARSMRRGSPWHWTGWRRISG